MHHLIMHNMFFRSLTAIAIASTCVLSLSNCARTAQASELSTESCIEKCHQKVTHALRQLSDSTGECDYSMAPRNIAPGDSIWHQRPVTAEEWCSGFWPGVLWLDYEASGDEEVARHADRYTRSIGEIVKAPVFDHDLGFLVLYSYGNGYRLTKNPEYREIMLNAADSLATLFNPKAGTICSWPSNEKMLGGHNTIMDNMINLELLFWAAKNGGDRRLYDIAVSHADTTMRYNFRPDGTSYHVAVYDKNTGNFIKACTHQGYADNSMWARGQAWAIYGYTMVYRETHDKKYLDFAQKVTDVYLKNLHADKIPYWDFNDPTIPECSRDASAACVVASALLELENYVDEANASIYDTAAKEMLTELSSERYWSASSPAFLLHSTGHRPAASEIDYSIVYADYYYYEALNRLKNNQSEI